MENLNITPKLKELVMNEAYEKAHYSSKLIAYCRAFSDIPYAKEILEELDNLQKFGRSEIELAPEEKLRVETEILLRAEARYLLVNNLLKKSGLKQVLELAAGLSPRGFTKDDDVIYVENDMRGLINDKEKILGEIVKKEHRKMPENLFFEKGDATVLMRLTNAARHFKKEEPIAIINEGLMLYLDRQKKITLAENIKKLLTKFGGVWITPDIGVKQENFEEEVFERKIDTKAEDSILKDLFNSLDEAKSFFEDLGFTVEVHSFNEVKDQMTARKNLKMENEEYVDQKLSTSHAFVMRLKTP